MRRDSRAISRINWQNPINWSHSHNRGLVSWWMAVPGRMGFGSSKWYDLCGQNDGTLSNFTLVSDWRPSGDNFGALNFSDNSSRVTVKSTPIIKASAGNSGTIIATVRPNNADSSDDCIYTEQGASGTVGPRLFKTAANKFNVSVRQSNGIFREAVSTTTISAGSLYHVCGTFNNPLGDIFIYINGREESSYLSWDGTFTSGDGETLVGDFGNAGTYAWGGEILSLKIYLRPLSSREVKFDYQQSRDYYSKLLNRRSKKNILVPSGVGGGSATDGFYYYRMMQG